MVNLILPTALNRSIKSIFILAIILLIRKMLNIKSIRWANIILWMIFFVYLLFPRSILITVTDFEKFGWLQDILRSMSVISGHIKKIEKEAGYILSPIVCYRTGSYICSSTDNKKKQDNERLCNNRKRQQNG